MESAWQSVAGRFSSKPKSKAERYGLKGGVPIGNTSNPPPPVVNIPQEPEHPEDHDQELFEGGGHISIPVRQPDDELGPLPPVSSEVSRSIVDALPSLDSLPGVQEARSLIHEILERAQGDSTIIAEIKSLQSDCATLFDFIEKLSPTSPEINEEVGRMRTELANTLAHLNHCSNNPFTRLRNKIAILRRTERCRVAYERIQKRFLVVQSAEIRNVQQTLIQQTSPTSSELAGEIQASEQELQRIIRQETGLSPEMIFSERIRSRWPRSYSDGRRFNVYKGELMNGDNVAIKISEKRILDNEGKEFGRRTRRHATTWKSFDNKYIIPFLGMGVEILKSESSNRDYYKLYFVSPWVPDGDAVTFIGNAHNQGLYVDVAKIVRDSALGLKYLHHMEEPCIHGSLRGENILIKRDEGIEQGCLNGFALTKKQIRNQPPPELTGEDFICRWKAPEILDFNSPLLEPPSDVWSWAMTALQLYSGLEPYHQYTKLQIICKEIISGPPPAREDYPDFDKYAPLPDKTWALLEKCWKKEPEERLKIKDILDELDRINAEANAGSD